MTSFFQRYKQADQHTIDIVNGYIKRKQTLLPFIQNVYYMIQSLVTHLIIAFFYNPEFFTDHDENFIKLNEARDIATYFKGDDDCKTVYGNFKINKHCYFSKFIWEYKIMRQDDFLVISIGLDTSNKSHAKNAFDDSDYNLAPFYAFESKSCEPKVYANDLNLKWHEKRYGVDYGQQEGAIVIMEFDAKKMTLRYYVNGEDQGIAFDDTQLVPLTDNVNYIAAISVNNDVSIQLLRFEQSLS